MTSGDDSRTMLRRIALPAGSLPARSPGPLGRILVRQWRDEIMIVDRPAAALRLVMAGDEQCEIDGRNYRIAAGHMMLIPAGSPMKVRSRDNGRGISIELPDGNPEDLPGALLLPLSSHPIGAWLHDLAGRLGGDADDAHDAATECLRGIHAQLTALVAACNNRMAGFDAIKPATRHDLLSRVEAARDFLAANLHRAVPLWELADHARLSPFHLSRAFRDSVGQSPAAYHRALKMRAAAARLAAGARPSQLAAAFGFADQSGFARAFVRHHGVPPGRHGTKNVA